MRHIAVLIAVITGMAGCALPDQRPETVEPDVPVLHPQLKTAADRPAPPAPERTPIDSPFAAIEAHPDAATAIEQTRRAEAEPEAPPSIWMRVRDGFGISDADHARVEQELAWFRNNPEYMERVVERAESFLHLIIEAIEARGLPTELVLVPVVESAFRPFAYSHGRAAGIWQFIPSTGRHYGLKQNWWYDGRRDIYASTEAALDYLDYLGERFDGDWLLALAAYNAGKGTVGRALHRNRQAGQGETFWDLAPRLPRETRAYVPRLLALRRVVESPESYGTRLPDIPDEPRLRTVQLDSQIDLALAAGLAGMAVDELYQLNPGFNRWATDPDGPHRLLLPIEHAEAFERRLAEVPDHERVRWRSHKVGRGETLSHVANRYRTTVSMLKELNGLDDHIIRAGERLVVPLTARAPDRLPAAPPAAGGPAESQREMTYEVRRGDTLSQIAQDHGVSVRELAEWNGIAPNDILRPGQELTIYLGDDDGDARAVPTATPSDPPFDPITRVSYTVRSGDTLSHIARRFNVSVDDLRRWNDMAPGSYLQPGQRLDVFVDVTRPGRT